MTLRACVLLAAVCWSSMGLAKPGPHPPFEVKGDLIKNHDGDTLHVRDAERGVIIIRLSGADTPESGQPYWRDARSRLHTLASGKQVTASCYKRDRYDREVCHVSTAGKDVGLSLIETGHAWFAFQYAAELTPEMRQRYLAAEEKARRLQRGLWQDPNPMPPWVFRKLKQPRHASK